MASSQREAEREKSACPRQKIKPRECGQFLDLMSKDVRRKK